MKVGIQNSQSSFNGRTKIFAITDTHQETRKTGAFLSKILSASKGKKNVLFIHDGDLFKGIYPRQLERDMYIKMKNLNPDIEMVMTLGNNDFGFNKEALDYLIDTVKMFAQKGIHVVCANIFDALGNRPEWLKPYAVVTRDGDKTLVTGFCIDNINTAKFGLHAKKQNLVLDEISQIIKNEKPDNVIVLNHDFMQSSQNIHRELVKKGVKVDITIGGHSHDRTPPDLDKHIYYPEAFGESMYEIELENVSGEKKVRTIKEQRNQGLSIKQDFYSEIEEFEKESNLLDKIVPSVLHLPKKYSEPSALGSFLADEIKIQSKSDIAFFSTGFLMKSLEYKPNSYITKYKLKKAMIAENPIKKVELTSSELFELFQHSLRDYKNGNSNPKFLQCSNNIMLEGQRNSAKNTWDLKQIYINNKPLFDENRKPLETDRKYICAIDSYIAEGGQGFTVLQNAMKSDVILNDKPLKINDALLNGLFKAKEGYKEGETYPHFMIKNG